MERHLHPTNNVETTRKVVELAHPVGVSVEGELVAWVHSKLEKLVRRTELEQGVLNEKQLLPIRRRREFC